MGSIARAQRDGPEAWIFHRLPANNASEAIDGVLVLALDDNLGTSVEPRWDPRSQSRMDGSKVSDGGWFRAEVPLQVQPSVPRTRTDTRGCGGSHVWSQCARISSLKACWFDSVWLRRWRTVGVLSVRAALRGRLMA